MYFYFLAIIQDKVKKKVSNVFENAEFTFLFSSAILFLSAFYEIV